jgi:hypothetical protein
VNSTREYELLAAVISAGNAKNAVLGYVAFCLGNVLTVIISTGNNIPGAALAGANAKSKSLI